MYQKIKKYCPLPCMILYGIGLIAAAVHLISIGSRSFADFYTEKISWIVRLVMAKLTGWIPISVAELILMCSPLILTGVVILTVRLQKKELYHSVRVIFVLLAILVSVYSVFALGFATGYRGSPIEAKMGLERNKVSKEELEQTARLLLAECDKVVDEIQYKYGSFSVMPYSLDEMNDKLNEAYDRAAKKYDFIHQFHSNVKYVILSEPWSYTHITGVYTFFTGEANININFPDYTTPFTAAHEMAHQRGIAPEDQANFMAFLACIESDDPYIRYSGYFNLFEYVYSALHSADKTAYNALWYEMNVKYRWEMTAYSEFFNKYRDNVAAKVSETVNNTYLEVQGQTDGTKSYGRVVDLAVAYLLYGTEN